MHDAVPGPFNGAVLVAEERHLDAGFDAVQATLANLGRSGHLVGGTPETKPDQSAQRVIAWRVA